ncbi:MAG: T9SS type A sorting domain-containing protein [Bacteroidetes bacterium]|nr:T9SS type A sorting domain-containing protein [Bacteroidota bacterium]
MKTKFIPISFVCLSLGIFAFRSELTDLKGFHKAPVNSGGAAAGKTGAPGEQNCTQCHSGTAQDGANENVLTLLDGSTPVTTYSPGQQYTVALVMSSNPAKKGFQATALTSANAMAGTFTAQAGNTSVNGNTKKYANHTSTSNTSTTLSWNWTWTAPASGTGDVTFYVATNKTNNNGTTSGDAIYLSQHLFSEESSAGVENITFNNNVVIGVNNESDKVMISYDLNQMTKTSINILDLNGKSIYNKNAMNGQIGNNQFDVSTNDFKSGIYIVNFFIDNKPFSKKIVVK